MYTYHEACIGIQINYTGNAQLKRFSEFCEEYDAHDCEPEGLREIIVEANDDDGFFATTEDYRFALDIARLLTDTPELILNTAYHGSSTMTPVWIQHTTLDKSLEAGLCSSDTEDYVVSPGQLKYIHELAIEMIEVIHTANIDIKTKNILKKFSGLLFVNKSS